MHAPLVSKDLDYISVANHDQPPRHLGSRFNADGEFLPEPGNTVVSHLASGSQTEKAIIATRQRFLDMPEASQLAFTPISSLHMTVFQGIIEFRRALPYWPENIPLDTPIDVMTDYYRDRFFAFPALPAFNMQVTGILGLFFGLIGPVVETALATAFESALSVIPTALNPLLAGLVVSVDLSASGVPLQVDLPINSVCYDTDGLTLANDFHM